MNLRSGLALAICLAPAIAFSQADREVEPRPIPLPDSDEQALGAVFDRLGSPKHHFVGMSRADLAAQVREGENFRNLRREKLGGEWRAALVSDDPSSRWAIQERFDSLEEMKSYLKDREAVIENWAYAENSLRGRRLTSHESAELSKGGRRPPTYQTATFLDPASGSIARGRLEFGIGAAAETLETAIEYERDRNLQSELRRVLRTRDADGNLSARAQIAAIDRARKSGVISIREMPSLPESDDDVLHAFECSTSIDGKILEVLRALKASQIKPRMIDGLTAIEIHMEQGTEPRTAVLVNPSPPRGVKGDTQPMAQGTEVRIRDPKIGNPRLWHRLEFGEPSMLRRQGLANFGLMNAHMEGARKDLVMKKARIDRVAEPVFAGLNIGGGLAGVGTPLGESARLGYNLLLGRKYVPDVPSLDEFRDLYSIHLAKTQDPQLQTSPPAKLSRSEMRRLRSAASQIEDQQVDDGLRSVSDIDLEAMLQLPRRQSNDQKYRLFADILTDLAKVTGESQSGIIRDIFDNQRVSLSGELSLTTTLAMAFGAEDITPLSGVSLKDLANGDGPAEAWLQYFNISLDLRAIANTSYLLRKKNDIDRELRKPFTYAPRMSDLAAYEIRIFGYPLLLRYKRGLLEDDIEAYENNYAYGVVGTRIVTHFPTQNDFYRELRSGNMAPIGLVKIPERRGFLFRRPRIESSLPVFGYKIPDGEHAGKTAIIIYGMSAHRSYSELMEREAQRFGQFETILKSGGVIERLVAAESPDELPQSAFEPVIEVDQETAGERYSKLLSHLLEYDRHVKFAAWQIPTTPEEELAARETASALRAQGVDVSPRSSPLVEVADHFGSYTYRKRSGGKWRLIQAVRFPSREEIDQDIKRRALEVQLEHEKLGSATGDSLQSH